MNPAGLAFTSLFGIGLGAVGFMEGMPALAGGGFAFTAALQLWTLGKLGPINIRLAVMEERMSRLEADVAGRIRNRAHGFNPATPPIED